MNNVIYLKDVNDVTQTRVVVTAENNGFAVFTTEYDFIPLPGKEAKSRKTVLASWFEKDQSAAIEHGVELAKMLEKSEDRRRAKERKERNT